MCYLVGKPSERFYRAEAHMEKQSRKGYDYVIYDDREQDKGVC